MACHGCMDPYAPGHSGLNGHSVGAAMRLARRRLGLSQRGLADALSWDRAKVGRWETGAIPDGFDEVIGVLRVLGFETMLTDPAHAEWAEWGDPAEHVLDRADRRFPAHLELCPEDTSTTWNWTRHRGEPSPHAAQTSFRRRTPTERMAEEARALAWQPAERRSENSETARDTYEAEDLDDPQPSVPEAS